MRNNVHTAQDRLTVTFDTFEPWLSSSIPCINLLSNVWLKYEIKEPQLPRFICGNVPYNAVFNDLKQSVPSDVQTSPSCSYDKQSAELSTDFQAKSHSDTHSMSNIIPLIEVPASSYLSWLLKLSMVKFYKQL